MNLSQRLKELRKKKKITQVELAAELDISSSTVAMWESDKRTPPADMFLKIADYFNVSMDYLMGAGKNQLPTEDIVRFPILVGVHAGFGNCIEEIESGEHQEIPKSILHGRKEEDFLVFRIEGESMSPKFLDGDHVLVSRQPSVDSGDIAIVCYEDFENGTIKKVLYESGCDYLDLIPLNPRFSPVRIQGTKLEGTRVIGKVVYLFRKI